MASAKVVSPTAACYFFIGSWLVTMVDLSPAMPQSQLIEFPVV